MSRITVDEAARLWHEASDDELRDLARAARARWHEPDRATYMVMRIVNYTNVCVAQCDYCAFYVLPNQDGGYVLDRQEVFAKIDELLEVGGDLVAFNGGFNPKLPLDFYCDLFASVRERYGDRVEFYALTVAEFVYLADRARLSHAEAAARLRDAGVYWITGGGSEILTEDFRKRHAKWKYTVAEYLEAQRAIVESGMRTTATMVIGFDETLEERLEHLQRTRDFQDECLRDGLDGLFSFLCWTYKPYGTAFGGREIAPREYWRHIALSRIFLDNVRHIRTSVLTLNEDAFRALDFGADDFDLPIEDEVTQKAGARIDLDLERLLEIPRGLGYRVEYRRAERPALTRLLAVAVDDRVGERVELVPPDGAVEALPRPPRVVERDLARPREGVGGGDPDEGALERPALQCLPDDLVLLRGEEERERRRPVAQVGPGHLPRLDRLARAVEDVVDDLERDAEQAPELRVPAAERTGGGEQGAGLERAPLEVRLDGRRRVVALQPLQRLAARQGERGVRERRDALLRAGGGERRERRREQMVAGRLRGEGAVRRPGRCAPTAELRAVDDVVVDERRHVDELDRDALDHGRCRVGGRRQERQGGAEPLASGRERIRSDGGDGAGVRLDDLRESRLDGVEVVGEPDGRPHGLERAHSVTPTCSATIVAPNRRNLTCSNPCRSISAASPSAPGKRRTLAGRYV